MAMLCADRGVCALLGLPVDAATLGQAMLAGALLILGLILGVLLLLSRGAPGQPRRTWPATVAALGGSVCGWALWPRRPPIQLSRSQRLFSEKVAKEKVSKVALAAHLATLSPVAVCMAGAARTIVHPVVLHAHRHHLLAPLMHADLFAVVNLRKVRVRSNPNPNPNPNPNSLTLTLP